MVCLKERSKERAVTSTRAQSSRGRITRAEIAENRKPAAPQLVNKEVRAEAGTGDLKEREYRAEGNIHHHTHTFEEQHERGSSQSSGQGRLEGEERKGSSNSGTSGSESLREREYRDKEGNEHHHTRTYEEQHKKSA